MVAVMAFPHILCCLLFRSFSHRSMSLLAIHLKKKSFDIGDCSEKPQLLCHPMVSLRPRHTAFLPKAIKDLMRFLSLQPKCFVGQIAERPCGAFYDSRRGRCSSGIDRISPVRCRDVLLLPLRRPPQQGPDGQHHRSSGRSSGSPNAVPLYAALRCGRLGRLFRFFFAVGARMTFCR